ncbi:hypothetical protein [Deferrisoma camini]|uniref:hypothetical protein n=1 Tax=Deferrisoma camini TaxID=1035120 RepID=UPI00046D4876|nr:hypothetical protein [Deferrisoma camini]
MGKPAGVQIRRWFFFLVALLVATNGGVLVGSWMVERSVTDAVERARPVVEVTGEIRAEILAAQREMFRYLAEFADDVTPALQHLDRLSEQVARARTLPGTRAMADDLDAMDTDVRRYRKVLELLPSTTGGTRDWARIQEYGATAVRLGAEVGRRAEKIATDALSTIRRRGKAAVRVARWARWAAVGTLGVSLITVFALARWWRRFQDLILGL